MFQPHLFSLFFGRSNYLRGLLTYTFFADEYDLNPNVAKILYRRVGNAHPTSEILDFTDGEFQINNCKKVTFYCLSGLMIIFSVIYATTKLILMSIHEITIF